LIDSLHDSVLEDRQEKSCRFKPFNPTFTCVEWQIIGLLCDPVWQLMLRSHAMGLGVVIKTYVYTTLNL